MSINIFISSPSDLIEERNKCREEIEGRLNNLIFNKYGVTLKCYLWERDGIGVGIPMNIIKKPEDCDLYIGMMWARFGSPTGRYDENGIEYPSGTVEEYSRAYKAFKESGRPNIIFLKKTVDPKLSSGYSEEQLKKVNEFINEFGAHGKHPGIIAHFEDTNALIDHINSFILKSVDETSKLALNNHYQQSGVSHLFLRGDSNARNTLKKSDLKSAKYLRLIAHSGYSFLCKNTNRYYDLVYSCLKRDGKVEIILANPYSEMGYYLTVGDTQDLKGSGVAERLAEFDKSNGIDVITQSMWVDEKQRSALRGFKALRKEFGNKITLKMCKYEMNSTILIADDCAYMEPYLHCIGSEIGMNAFEIRLRKQNNSENSTYLSICQYFELLWYISEDYDTYLTAIEKHKEALQTWLSNK